jgi:hypothetical protein
MKRETILYEFLDRKDLNKTNGEEKWWCDIIKKFENLIFLCIKNY